MGKSLFLSSRGLQSSGGTWTGKQLSYKDRSSLACERVLEKILGETSGGCFMREMAFLWVLKCLSYNLIGSQWQRVECVQRAQKHGTSGDCRVMAGETRSQRVPRPWERIEAIHCSMFCICSGSWHIAAAHFSNHVEENLRSLQQYKLFVIHVTHQQRTSWGPAALWLWGSALGCRWAVCQPHVPF